MLEGWNVRTKDGHACEYFRSVLHYPSACSVDDFLLVQGSSSLRGSLTCAASQEGDASSWPVFFL